MSESLEMVPNSQEVGRIVYFYVVDEEVRLQDIVATRNLLLSSPQAKIADIMSSKTMSALEQSDVVTLLCYFNLGRWLLV